MCALKLQQLNLPASSGSGPLEAVEDKLALRKKKKIFVQGAPCTSRREIDHLRSTFLVIGAYERERRAAHPWPLVPDFCRRTRPRRSKVILSPRLGVLTIKSDVFSEHTCLGFCFVFLPPGNKKQMLQRVILH